MMQPKPAVVTWFQLYCWILAGMYLLVVGFGVALLFLGASDAMEMERGEAVFVGVLCIALGAVFMAIMVAASFLPRRPWAWIVDLVLICIGFTSCLTLPFCVALLIFWLKPETKAYFGRA